MEMGPNILGGGQDKNTAVFGKGYDYFWFRNRLGYGRGKTFKPSPPLPFLDGAHWVATNAAFN